MFYMPPKIDNYLKTSTNKEVKYFVVIRFGGCFKSTRQKPYSKLGKKILEKLPNHFILF